MNIKKWMCEKLGDENKDVTVCSVFLSICTIAFIVVFALMLLFIIGAFTHLGISIIFPEFAIQENVNCFKSIDCSDFKTNAFGALYGLGIDAIILLIGCILYKIGQIRIVKCDRNKEN